MPSTDLLLALLAAALVVAYMPGPALLYAAAQTLARGRRAGLMAALGLHIGGYVHVIAAAAGLSALLHAAPAMYTILKLIGAGYLIYLGGGMLLRAMTANQVVEKPVVVNSTTARQVFAESVVVEILNPKTALFFIAFLPQFVDPAAQFPLWIQFLILGTLVNLVLASADLLCVFCAGIFIDRLRQSSRIARLAEGLGGGLLITLGVNIAMQRSQ